MRILAIIICLLSLTGCKLYKDRLQYLDEQNVYVNKLIIYKMDPVDNWQTPNETLELGAGDCEDYAILKQSLIGEGTVYLVYLMGVKPNPYHAVLITDDGYVLDNRYPTLQHASQYNIITPLTQLRK